MSYASCTFILLVGTAAFAQNPESPRQILEKVRESYTGVRRFELAGNLEVANAGVSQPRMTMPFRLVVEYPDKLRMEGSMGAMTPGATPGGATISDGKTTWKYDAQLRSYTRQAGPPDLDLDMDDSELQQMGIPPSSPAVVKLSEVLFASFRKLAELSGHATVLRTQTLRPMGTPAECYVVETQEPPSTVKAAWWIDTKRYRILRMEATEHQIRQGKPVDITIRMNFDTVSLNEPLPDGVFSFVPPADAKQVEKLQ